MKKSLTIIFSLAVCVNFLAGQNSAQARLLHAKIDSQLIQFRQTEEVHFLYEVYHTIGQSKELRRIEKRRLALQLIRSIEEKIDFEFDPAKRPRRNAVRMEPGDMDGMFYYSGMDPDSIKNEKVRVLMIRQRNDYREQWHVYRLQDFLHRHYDRVISLIEQVVLSNLMDASQISSFYKEVSEYLLYPEKLEPLREGFKQHLGQFRKE